MNSTRSLVLAFGLAAAFSLPALAQVYQYQEADLYSWGGTQSAVVLPIRNEAKTGDAALGLKAGSILRQAMLQSKKFELVAIHPFNPAIRRATAPEVGLLAEDAVDTAINEPTVENVLPVANVIGIDVIADVSIQEYKLPTVENPRVEIALVGTLVDAATGDQRLLRDEGPALGVSSSNPLAVDPKRLETEALSAACNNLVRVFCGGAAPTPPPPPRVRKHVEWRRYNPKPKPAAPTVGSAPRPKPPVAVAQGPTTPTPMAPAPTPAPAGEKPKRPLGKDVHLPIEWLYYLISIVGIAGL